MQLDSLKPLFWWNSNLILISFRSQVKAKTWLNNGFYLKEVTSSQGPTLHPNSKICELSDKIDNDRVDIFGKFSHLTSGSSLSYLINFTSWLHCFTNIFWISAINSAMTLAICSVLCCRCNSSKEVQPNGQPLFIFGQSQVSISVSLFCYLELGIPSVLNEGPSVCHWRTKHQRKWVFINHWNRH